MSKSAYKELVQAISTLTEAERNSLKAVLDGFNSKKHQPSFPRYTVNFTYDKTVEQMTEVGKYDGIIDLRINSDHFFSTESGNVLAEVYLVKFDRDLRSEDVIKKMGEMNPPLRPVTLKELQSLGAQHPELQRKFYIFALGSAWLSSYKHIDVPYLGASESFRFLRLAWWGGVWKRRSGLRFAAVLKSL